jgi:hypothetical protein
MVTSLLFLEARVLGRGEPPCGFDAGDDNLRRYVGNGPTNATDPTGLEPDWDAIAQQKAQAEAILNDPKKKRTYRGSRNRNPDFTAEELRILAEWEKTEGWLRTYQGKIPARITGSIQSDPRTFQMEHELQRSLGRSIGPIPEEKPAPQWKGDGISSSPELRQYVTLAVAKFNKGVADGTYKPESSNNEYGPKLLGLSGAYNVTADWWILIDLGDASVFPGSKIVAQVIAQSSYTNPALESSASAAMGGQVPLTSNFKIVHSPLKIVAIQLSYIGEKSPSELFRNPATLYKTAEEKYKDKKWGEFLNNSLAIGEYIPVVKTAIKVDDIIRTAQTQPNKLTVWDYADATWSFIDDVLTVTGPFLHSGSSAATKEFNGVKLKRIVVLATDAEKSSGGISLGEKASALAADRELLKYTKDGSVITFLEDGLLTVSEREAKGAITEAATAIEKGGTGAGGALVHRVDHFNLPKFTGPHKVDLTDEKQLIGALDMLATQHFNVADPEAKALMGKSCGAFAVATDTLLNTGEVTKVAATGVMWPGELAAHYGSPFNPVTPRQLATQFAEQPGKTGIVYIFRVGKDGKQVGLGHYVNVVNRNGVVQYLDGQFGEILDDANDLLSLLQRKPDTTIKLEVMVTHKP